MPLALALFNLVPGDYSMSEQPYIPAELLARLNSHLPADAQLTMEHLETFVTSMIDAWINLDINDRQVSAMLALLWTHEVWEARQDTTSDPGLFTSKELDLIAGQFMMEFERAPTKEIV
jgi:hypothetical protein